MFLKPYIGSLFLQPLVWACLGGAVVLMAGALWVANHFSPSSNGQDNLTFFKCFWAILGSSVDQGMLESR